MCLEYSKQIIIISQEQKELCAKVVSQKGLIVTCIKLLGQASEFVEEYPTSLDKITPKFVCLLKLDNGFIRLECFHFLIGVTFSL